MYLLIHMRASIGSRFLLRTPSTSTTYPLTGKAKTERILNTILSKPHADGNLHSQLQDNIKAKRLSQGFAARIYHGLVKVVDDELKMGEEATLAYNTAKKHVNCLTEDETAATKLIVVGILTQLAPGVLDALGFTEYGAFEGYFAAHWLASLQDQIRQGCLAPFFEDLGMNWRRGAIAGLQPWK